MKNLDDYSCPTRHVLRLHWQKLWQAAIMVMAVFLVTTNASAQDPNLPSPDRCTSKDLEIISAELTGANQCYSCTEGQQITSTLTLGILNKTGSLRTSFAFWATLEITGADGIVTSSPIKGCSGPIGADGTFYLPYGSITYTCGDNLKLKNIYLAWTDASDNENRQCPLDASGIAPKCGTLGEIEIIPPLSVGITASTNPCIGEANGSITASAQGGDGPYTYTISPGGTSNSTGVFTGLTAGAYTITVTDANNCTTTVQHTLTAISCCVPPTITAQPTADAACVGQGASFTVGYSGGNPTPTIQWEVSTNDGGTWMALTNTAPYSGVTTATLTIATTTQGMDGNWYRAVLTSGTCAPVQTTPAELTVYGLPVVYSLQGSSYCAGSTALGTITLADSESGVSYQLYTSAGATVGAPKPGSGEALIWTSVAAGTGYYVVATGPGDCTSTTGTANVTVTANPTVYDLEATNYCAGAAGMGTITLEDSDAGVTYQLYNSANATVQASKNGTGEALVWTGIAAGTGYYVRATGTGDCTSTTNTVNVVANPNPVATATVTGKLTCTVTSVQLSGSADIAVTSYAWTGPNGFMSGVQNPMVSAEGTYTLTVTTAAGCTDTDQVIVESDDELPVVTAGSYGPLCVDATAIVLGGSPVGGTWTGTGVVAANGGYQFNPATAGAGSHVLTYSYTAANGCTATATATIVVNGLPAAYTLTGGAYCTGATPAGATVTLSDSDAGVSYQLQINNGGTWTNVGMAVNGTGNSISFGIQPVGSYRVMATNTTTGCDDAFGSATVTVNPLPNANAGQDQTLTCATTTVTLTGSSTTAGVTYAWSGPGGYMATTATIQVSTAGTYTLTVTNPATGCYATDVVEVEENDDLPVVNVRTDTTPVLKCTNNEIEIQGGSPTPGAVYSWVGPNGFTATTRNITVSVGGMYTLTVTDPATGCSASASIEIFDVRKDLNANAGPDMVLTCTVNQVTLQGSSITAGALGYHWTASDGGRIVSGQGTLNPVVDAAGTYILYVVDIYSGCNDTDIVVVTRENTQVHVSAQGGTLDCVTGTLKLMGSSTTAGVVYSWTGPGGFMSDEQNPTVNMAGEYTLTVRIPNSDCAASKTVTVMPAQGGTRTEVVCYEIDFEQHNIGLVTSTVTNAGIVQILGQRRMSDGPIALGNHAAIFDSGMPTGDDEDLHTMDWGKVLIINQDRTNVPNDNQWGGALHLDFSAFGPVTMTSLRALDIDEYEDWSWVVLYDANGKELHRVQLQPLGNNSQQLVDLGNTKGVMSMRVYLDGTGVDYVGSGAIDQIKFCVERVVEVPCTTPEPENCFIADFNQEQKGLITSTTTNAGEIGILGRRRTADGPIALGNHAAIFDSGMPTGDDADLHTMDWGNVLIINQDRTNVPNDNQWGGVLELDFSAFGPVTMYSLKALDIDEYEDWSWVKLYDGNGNELYSVQLQPLGNNSKQTVDLGGTSGVMLMKVYLDGTGVDFVGSGAIDDIMFCIDGRTPAIVPLGTAPKASELKGETIAGIEASAYPMPFTDKTTLEFKVAEAQDYVVQLYDSKGQLVRELKAGNARAGELVSVEIDGTRLSDGLYFANIVGKSGIKKSVKLIHRK